MITVPIIPDTSPIKYHFNAVPMPLGRRFTHLILLMTGFVASYLAAV